MFSFVTVVLLPFDCVVKIVLVLEFYIEDLNIVEQHFKSRRLLDYFALLKVR